MEDVKEAEPIVVEEPQKKKPGRPKKIEASPSENVEFAIPNE